MRLTIHAGTRAVQRTKLGVEHIASLVRHNAVVSLGTSGKYEFVLFYSHPDRGTKVLVMSQNRKTIVSIWQDYFLLPEGVKQPGSAERRKAKKLYLMHTFERLVEVPEKKPRSELEKSAGHLGKRLRIEVYRGLKVEYVHDCPDVHMQRLLHLDDMIFAARNDFQLLAEIVEKNKEAVGGDIYYRISIVDPDLKFYVGTARFKHSTLLTRLKAAPP